METYLFDWASLLLRWAHVIVAIAWIGSSFYFVFLDNSLLPPVDPEQAPTTRAAAHVSASNPARRPRGGRVVLAIGAVPMWCSPSDVPWPAR